MEEAKNDPSLLKVLEQLNELPHWKKINWKIIQELRTNFIGNGLKHRMCSNRIDEDFTVAMQSLIEMQKKLN